MFSDRIKQIREDAGLTQQAFGKRILIAQTTIAAYENGRRVPADTTLSVICREFGVNREWLKSGKGAPYTDPDEDIARLVGMMLKGENDTARKVFKALAKLGPEDWKSIEKLIDCLKQ